MAPQRETEGETTPLEPRENSPNNGEDENVINFQEVRYGMESFHAIVGPGKFLLPFRRSWQMKFCR